MNFDKYKTRGAYHYQWYKNNTFSYRDCVDKCVEFCKGSILDVGCGDGVVMTRLWDKGYEVAGIDKEVSGRNVAPLIIKKAIMIADVDKPIKGKWDYMVCLNVIEHLEHPEAIKRIFNQNITKAAIIITDMPGIDTDPYHFHEYTAYELKQLFPTRKVKYFTIGKDFHGIEVYK